MSNYDYDIAIIGGGSGGVACAKECAALGAKVLLADATEPNARGISWHGLGGTCSHAGCVPKKYMHSAAILRVAAVEDSAKYGLHIEETAPLDWPQMITAIQEKISGTDWVYRVEMREKKINYKQWMVRFDTDAHHLVGVDTKGAENRFSARYVVIACGCRPSAVDIPGADLCINSDDFFYLDHAPGRTLCIGASYIALELAGVLAELGFGAEVMVRSQALRMFDQDCAVWVTEYMEKRAGVKFHNRCQPVRVYERDRKRVVVFVSTDGSFEGEREEEFDTVIMAIGRTPVTNKLNLGAAGVNVLENGKIAVNEQDQTNVADVFAIGDIRSPGVELTPVAIANGRILARRLFGGSNEVMNFRNVPTTTFTPMEYGFVGMSEPEAQKELGENLEVFLTSFKPMEYVVPERAMAFGKILVRKSDDVIVGIHYVGPNAGEVIQGLALAVCKGMTKKQLDETVCIHPTAAERLIGLTITRSSGAEFAAASCCG